MLQYERGRKVRPARLSRQEKKEEGKKALNIKWWWTDLVGLEWLFLSSKGRSGVLLVLEHLTLAYSEC